MLETIQRIRPRRDGGHFYQQYFLYWTAFNNIYTVIAYKKGIHTQIKKRADGSVFTALNGNVHIPEIVEVTDKEQMYLALHEFNDLKQSLIRHKGTQYFLTRLPYWKGKPIEYDAFGQKVNGVLAINYMSDSQYPVWSPIDQKYYQAYIENPDNPEIRNFLAGQILDLLFTIRNNMMLGSREFDDSNDQKVIENALPMLALIVNYFTQ